MINKTTCAYCLFVLVPITGHMRVSIYIQSCASWILYRNSLFEITNDVYTLILEGIP